MPAVLSAARTFARNAEQLSRQTGPDGGTSCCRKGHQRPQFGATAPQSCLVLGSE